MKHYKVEEFLMNSKPGKFADEVEKKISILYDFCLLRRRKQEPDAREDMVRDLFLKLKSMDTVSGIVRDLQFERITINELLRRNHYEI